MTEQMRTARMTGVWYLGLAVTGMLGFLLVRPAIYAEGDPTATVANLQDKEAGHHGQCRLPGHGPSALPRGTGWVLVVGGVGYLLSSLVDYGFASPPGLLVDALAFPATIGEFWMIGHLPFLGIRPAPVAP